MIKNASTDERETVHAAADFGPERQKRLDIKRIRSLLDHLRALPDDEPMPDWSDLTIGDRFAIVVRLVPPEQRIALLGKSDSHVRRYERGLDIPLTVVAALTAETEIPLEWIVSGKAMPRRGEGQPSGCNGAGTPYGDDVSIRKLSLRVASGRGLVEEAAERVRLPRSILDQAGIAPEDVRLVQAFGESMRPTINDGDTLLVDVSPAAKQVVEGRIYFFSVGEDAFIKRLRRMGDQVLMISDNREMFPDAETVPQGSTFRVYGRVKWAGRSL